MILGEKNQSTFKLNQTTKATIKSEKLADGVFKHKVILEHEALSIEPLMFESKAQVAKLISGIDLEDDQLNMFESGGKQ